ncbi:DMT family transporter [Roseivirga thermotolerans]|uniref:Membrane protein n=1 Tax=Roseivirga thermotolerans TaxID=1758176 RepID=A0ABQ3I4Q8_9BACT|nr:DMT family transporter [Roseivirga thermotolerans]GHE55909.1 membrane protein [Roseivirga thermotolerans]
MNPRYYVEGLIAVFIFGITPVFIKEVSANAFTIGVVRLSIGIVFLYFLARHSNLKKLNLKEWRALLWIGLLFGAHWVTYFISVKMSTPSMAILSVSSFGVHMIYLNWLIKGVKPRLTDVAAVMIAVVGIFLIIPDFDLQNDVTAGILIGLCSALFFAILPFVQQRHQHIDSMSRAFGQYTFAMLVFLLFSAKTNWNLTQIDWVYLAILGVICTVVAHTLWLRASTMLPPTNTSLIFYLGSPIAMFTSYLFLNEEMSSSKLIGAGLIISANIFGVLMRRSGKKRPA